MSDLDDPTDVYDPDDEVLRRPLPPRTWRDRLDDLAAAGGSPGRVVGVVVAVVVVVAVGLRLLAPPAPPPEAEIPLAEPVAAADGAAAAGGGAAGDAPVEAAATAPGVDATGGAGGAVPASDGTLGTAGESGAAGQVVVHVVGAVAAPGVQRLPAGARVVDAVGAAGGATGDADLARINLAAALVDGQQVYVLRIGEEPPLPPVGAAAGAEGAAAVGGDAAGGPVDINRASAAELEELPGVGPATAEAIIAHREQNGPFASVDDLIDVRGIGDAKLEQIRPQATV
ncbi:MAG TPA: helix-hairpin-helix domain-containing protein [Acidimicrobiales bacterium]|nr:helix-hairpin-helix domain-containing protein [Acidimicrobiales bacterium]